MELEAAWPVHGLRLATPDLILRPMREEDLGVLCDLLPDDVEQDPSATRYAGLGERANRHAVVVQSYGRHLGLWSPDDWTLSFVVRRGGAVIGVQTLEGPDYRAERIVDSASWLVVAARGSGLGQQMRAAVLELAFRHLGAVAAISSAVLGNRGSLGVSRALGYAETHRSVLTHSGQTLQHLRVERATWQACGLGAQVRIDGLAAALPYFGVGDERD